MCLPLIALAGQALTAIPGVTNAVVGHLNKRQDALTDQHKVDVEGDTKVNVELLKADLESRRIASANKGPVWMLALFVVPYAIHNAAIVLDSTFRFSWDVDALPAPFNAIESQVILMVAGITAGGVALKKLFAK